MGIKIITRVRETCGNVTYWIVLGIWIDSWKSVYGLMGCVWFLGWVFEEEE